MSELNRLAAADRVRIAGFVVMPDHVHALLWFDDDRRLAEAMNVWKADERQVRRVDLLISFPEAGRTRDVTFSTNVF